MPRAGYVYIVHGVGTSYIKIGQTRNFPKRLADLEHGVPFELDVFSLTRVTDMDMAEQALLQHYAAYATRGEWFAVDASVLSQWIMPESNNEPSYVKHAMLDMMERILLVIHPLSLQPLRMIQGHISGVSKSRIEDALRYMVEKGYLRFEKHGFKETFSYSIGNLSSFIDDMAHPLGHPLLTNPRTLHIILSRSRFNLAVENVDANTARLHVEPFHKLTPAMCNEIRAHKAGLIAYINSKRN